ncbi:alanine racemase [Thermovenabulum gondwanense]|uniref:D-threo-3-hydroxyaspartate dehydratase n=1 Tax=Thermovenabulum gondwanense TaxID=520767 RepID=A0A162MZS9_9FIRM|nr:alanine racemase [Thermovenabulum gondwanense]KYO68610.1 D-threo-3-hydroxyaspartate dehydratase [Thermovenabulum gondwanense]
MTEIFDLPTPAFLVDLDKLENNLRGMADLCRENKKQLWPMVKTHKSIEIAKMQADLGAKGFLVGTIDEAEKLVEHGFKEIMLAYPVASKENIERVITLAKKAHIILSFDTKEAASKVDKICEKEGLYLDYLIIIDSGLHRFGVIPEKAPELAKTLREFHHLKFKGIATHPGHVYAKTNSLEVKAVAEEEVNALRLASNLLEKEGFIVEIIATGSTPTAFYVAKDDKINVLRPGNYVFYDAIQVALGIVPEERCALTVIATIVSRPKDDLFIIDAGSKCFGLDKGAHGVFLTAGYGIVKGHPELTVESLSEEVGKIRISGNTNLKVGDKIEVIPNHACSSANMTSFLIGHRRGLIEKILPVDARGGSRIPILK